jgi:hypothetical protein
MERRPPMSRPAERNGEVALHPRPGRFCRYFTAMIRRRSLRPEPYLLRPIQLLLLLVALAAALGRERVSGTASPCAQHLGMTSGAAMVAGDASTPASEDRRSAPHSSIAAHDAPVLTTPCHGCTHCPPSQCATMVPCVSGGPFSQSAPACIPTLVNPPVYAVREAITVQRVVTVSPQPPTPPPQVAS